MALWGREFTPLTDPKAAQFKTPNPHANETQSWMADGGGHASHLPVLSFDQLQANPTGRHGFAEADWRITRWNVRLRFQGPGAAWQGRAALDDQSCSQPGQRFGCRLSFDLRPVFTFVGVSRVQQPLV